LPQERKEKIKEKKVFFAKQLQEVSGSFLVSVFTYLRGTTQLLLDKFL
jgi:hypothetical protein